METLGVVCPTVLCLLLLLLLLLKILIVRNLVLLLVGHATHVVSWMQWTGRYGGGLLLGSDGGLGDLVW